MAASSCPRCGQRSTFMSAFCATCKPIFENIRPDVRRRIASLLGETGPLGPGWDQLLADIAATKIPPHFFLNDHRRDCVNWLARYQALLLSDDHVTDEERNWFYRAANRLQLPPAAIQGLKESLERCYALSEIRSGRLTQISTGDIHLPIDERCFYISAATRWRTLKAGFVPTHGQILMTNKQLTFAGSTAGGHTTWAKIVRVARGQQGAVMIEASTSKMSGWFTVADPEWFCAIATTLIRIDRRQVLDGRTGRTAIPQHIKAEVWQRDTGRCQECGLDGSGGASLEFDHIIPIALGGANSATNLQILCRTCNGRKSARI